MKKISKAATAYYVSQKNFTFYIFKFYFLLQFFFLNFFNQWLRLNLEKES